ncbi:MAG: cytochrome c [Chloroflexi bacterium]|nr:cytochrome c [Chloroflexota bacterium]
MDKRVLAGFAMTVLVMIIVPAYWLQEPARQSQALQRQQHQTALLGAEAFVTYCTVCHGDRGQGLVGPRLRDTAYEEAALGKIISRGRPGTVMPAWSSEEGGALKEHQIAEIAFLLKHWDDAVVDEAYKLAHGAVPTPTTATKVTPSTGQGEKFIAQGQALFTEKGCVICHGLGAGGTGLAPSIKRRPPEVVRRQVRNPVGKMPTFPADRLSDTELDAIIAYLNSL